MIVLINPGTGPVRGKKRLALAKTNIKKFVVALGIDEVTVCGGDDLDEDGYAKFTLRRKKYKCEIDMPGIGIKRLRCEHEGVQLDTQRLYVDGNSWYWPYAIEIVVAALAPKSRRCAELDEAFDRRFREKMARWS